MPLATPIANPMDNAFWTQSDEEREAVLAGLRSASSPAFFSMPIIPDGFYLLARHADVVEASRHPEVFGSEPAATTLEDAPVALRESTPSMINLDDPRHARLRRLVSRAFTPRMISRFQDEVTAIAVRIAGELVERGPCDFVSEVATPMPLEIICRMMGVPRSQWPAVIEASEIFLAISDPATSVSREQIRETIGFFAELMADLTEERRKRPADDLVTALVNAEVDGEGLTELELTSFFRLLIIAGNETTRNGLSHGLILLTEHPQQRDLLLADLDGRMASTVEEIIRFATPVTWMRRTLRSDYDLNGCQLRAGESVVLHYRSANRDETVFEQAHEFQVLRSPNPHVGFGGPGPHFCLGAHLARREISVLLRELYRGLPNLHAAGPAERDPAGLINTVCRLPCAF